jgi:hypothetical protein
MWRLVMLSLGDRLTPRMLDLDMNLMYFDAVWGRKLVQRIWGSSWHLKISLQGWAMFHQAGAPCWRSQERIG